MTHKTNEETVYLRRGSGPTVVLVHGLGVNQGMWQWLLPALTKHFDVVSYDLWGHGESSNPPSIPNLQLFSQQILNLINDLGIAVTAVVGFSIGGMIARRFAYDHPTRLSALAILNSSHDRTDYENKAVQIRADQARERGPAAMVDAALNRWFTEEFKSKNPKTMELVKRWLEANNPDIYPQIYRVLADGDTELVDKIEKIKCPTLVMTGEEDLGNSPDMAYRMAKVIPTARCIILPKLKHMAVIEDPDQFNGHLISFLIDSLSTNSEN